MVHVNNKKTTFGGFFLLFSVPLESLFIYKIVVFLLGFMYHCGDVHGNEYQGLKKSLTKDGAVLAPVIWWRVYAPCSPYVGELLVI